MQCLVRSKKLKSLVFFFFSSICAGIVVFGPVDRLFPIPLICTEFACKKRGETTKVITNFVILTSTETEYGTGRSSVMNPSPVTAESERGSSASIMFNRGLRFHKQKQMKEALGSE